MNTASIRRIAMLAMLATAPIVGTADGMRGQEQKAQKQTGAPAEAGKTGAANQGGNAPSPKAPDTVVMLVPIAIATKDNSMKSGCWARIYSGTNYSGDTLTLTGPLSIADMSGPFGMNWDDKVDSIEIGPKATLTVFDNEQFRDQVAQFKPGQKVPDISKPLGFFDEFASVRLNCAKP